MMRANSLPRSIAFAVVAAIGWIPWAVIAAPLIGVGGAHALYLIGVVAFYVGGLVEQGMARLRVTFIVGLAGAGVALAAGTTTMLVIGLTLVLGVARSGFLYPTDPSRAVVREALLLVSGLCLARFVSGPFLPSTALALWSFLLVQSLFFLVPREAGRARPRPDPFDEARRRTLELLQGQGSG